MSYLKLGALSLVFAVGAGTFLAGCGNTGDTKPGQPAATAVEIPKGMEHIADLPKEEQKAALEQRICPVSEKPLGSMEGIQKVTLDDGREVFICCGGCEEALRQDPQKYLTKLENTERR